MSEPLIISLGFLTGAICICSCVGLASNHINHNNHSHHAVVVSHETSAVVVQPSVGSDEPEDPVDFSSKPKSSATSLGS